MKRILSFALVLTLAFALVLPVMATDSNQTITPRYSYISMLETDLRINQSSGIATCGATCRTSGASSVKLVCRLQRYENGYWSTVYSWTSTGTNIASIGKQRAVYSGYTYRTFTSCYVYNASGALVEVGSIYGPQKVY